MAVWNEKSPRPTPHHSNHHGPARHRRYRPVQNTARHHQNREPGGKGSKGGASRDGLQSGDSTDRSFGSGRVGDEGNEEDREGRARPEDGADLCGGHMSKGMYVWSVLADLGLYVGIRRVYASIH